MKVLIVTCLALTLMTGLAMADKEIESNGQPDIAGQAMDSPSRIQLSGVFDAGSPVWDRVFAYNGNLPSMECLHPMNDSSSDGQYYNLFCISSTDDNPIEISVNADATELEDTTLYLYCDPFLITQPLDNCVFYDDDGHPVELYSQIGLYDNIVLPVGVEYWVVLSTYEGGDAGAFVLDLSDNLTVCGGVAVEAMDWSTIKSLFQ